MTSEKTSAPIGVLLMTYGSPQTLDDVPAYMANVYGGRTPTPDLVDEFRRRYDLIGGSPLVAVTYAQAAALEEALHRRDPSGPGYRVAVGMRFSAPYIADGLGALADAGVDQVVGVIMSPQYSPILMSGYVTAVARTAESLPRAIVTRVAGAWHSEPLFLQATANRIREALRDAPRDTFVLLSAHSMPKRVVESEPDYIAQLQETATAVARLANLEDDSWGFCYQSAGHTQEEWLKPDFADMMPELAAAGRKSVLIAPVQFLADHLEILYDIEIGARAQAEEHGLAFARTASLNTSPLFIEALAAIVERELAEAQERTMPEPIVSIGTSA